MSQNRSALSVTFYTKAGCHLCNDAREMLDEIAEQYLYRLTETDIRSTTELFERYRYRIPVIIINDIITIEGKIDYTELVNAFQQSLD